MLDGDDNILRRRLRKHDGIRETLDASASDAGLARRGAIRCADVRRGAQLRSRVPQLGEKLPAEPRTLLVVPGDGRSDLCEYLDVNAPAFRHPLAGRVLASISSSASSRS